MDEEIEIDSLITPTDPSHPWFGNTMRVIRCDKKTVLTKPLYRMSNLIAFSKSEVTTIKLDCAIEIAKKVGQKIAQERKK